MEEEESAKRWSEESERRKRVKRGNKERGREGKGKEGKKKGKQKVPGSV